MGQGSGGRHLIAKLSQRARGVRGSRVCACVRVYMHICIRVCVHTHVCAYVNVYLHPNVYEYVCAGACGYATARV